MGKGSRWPDKEDDYRNASKPKEKRKPAPLIEKPKPRRIQTIEKSEYKDYGQKPLRSMRSLIHEMLDADPKRKLQSISNELEDMGYEAPVNTIYYVRAEYLGLPTYRAKGETIIRRPASSPRPIANKRIPPSRR